jgi:hypothetical protein
MTLQDFIDVMDMRGEKRLIIYHGLNRLDLFGDDELSLLSEATRQSSVTRISPIIDGIAVGIEG